jgi:hypothetical protein
MLNHGQGSRAFPENVDIVMRGLVPRVHGLSRGKQGVDGRDKRGHDGTSIQSNRKVLLI